MGKIKVTKEEIKEYRRTSNGRKKYIWMYAGIIIDIISTLGVSILIMNSYRLPSPVYFYVGLYILLVIVVLGGELIGVYFGAREQYFYDQHQKKVLRIDE